MEAFTLTFVAEWGDRTQLATITLASAHDALGVLLGAIGGHAMCAALAVMCGNLIAGRISERWLTAVGGSCFWGLGCLPLWRGLEGRTNGGYGFGSDLPAEVLIMGVRCDQRPANLNQHHG